MFPIYVFRLTDANGNAPTGLETLTILDRKTKAVVAALRVNASFAAGAGVLGFSDTAELLPMQSYDFQTSWAPLAAGGSFIAADDTVIALNPTTIAQFGQSAGGGSASGLHVATLILKAAAWAASGPNHVVDPTTAASSATFFGNAGVKAITYQGKGITFNAPSGTKYPAAMRVRGEAHVKLDPAAGTVVSAADSVKAWNLAVAPFTTIGSDPVSAEDDFTVRKQYVGAAIPTAFVASFDDVIVFDSSPVNLGLNFLLYGLGDVDYTQTVDVMLGIDLVPSS